MLAPWKMVAIYCQAVRAHDQRVALDGSPAEPAGARRAIAPARVAPPQKRASGGRSLKGFEDAHAPTPPRAPPPAPPAAVDLSRFVGLEDVFDDIDQLVDAQAGRISHVGVLLVAPRGTGKSN